MKYRSTFISDIHPGTRFSKTDAFVDSMRKNKSQNLYLAGDIIDGWAIRRKIKCTQSHSDVIQKLLGKARKVRPYHLRTYTQGRDNGFHNKD